MILAPGAPALRDRVQPVFDAIGHRTVWLDPAGDGSRLKVVLNNSPALLVEGMAPRAKDAALDLDAAGDHATSLPLTEAPLRRWSTAIEPGHGGDDVAAAVSAVRRAASAP
ncbi:hypothetical protein [Streptomyces scopuliridis]|uniref:hypothetical protein n=1 Tax=Streptomyces scopuliridis TaxID=452529 RepID=UPI00342A2DC5